MLRRHLVLLIAFRLSDGDVKPGGPLGAFREEKAMNRHWVSPSSFLSSSSTQHNNTTQTVTLTVTLPQLSTRQYSKNHTRKIEYGLVGLYVQDVSELSLPDIQRKIRKLAMIFPR